MGHELLVSQRQHELIQVWSLCRPLFRRRNRHGELHSPCFLGGLSLCDHLLVFSIEQLEVDIALTFNVNLDFKSCILISFVEHGLNAEVLEVCGFGEAQEEDISEDTAHTPLVLVFDVGGIAVLVYTNSKDVLLATLDVFGYVELCRVSRTLVIPNERAVDPDVVC